MRRYLLPHEGRFYKANLHCHSTISDGKWTPEEIKENYKNHGYSIVAYTDHDVFVTHNELADESFLPLNGYELAFAQEKIEGKSSKTCHVCFVSLEKDLKTQRIFYPSQIATCYCNLRIVAPLLGSNSAKLRTTVGGSRHEFCKQNSTLFTAYREQTVASPQAHQNEPQKSRSLLRPAFLWARSIKMQLHIFSKVWHCIVMFAHFAAMRGILYFILSYQSLFGACPQRWHPLPVQ